MAKLVDQSSRCTGCKKVLDSMSSGEVWHEACYQKHRKNTPGCTQHVLCERMNQSK